MPRRPERRHRRRRARLGGAGGHRIQDRWIRHRSAAARATTLALAVAAGTLLPLTRADRTDPPGDAPTVAVATRDLAAGAVIGADDISWQHAEVPAAGHALGPGDRVEGRTVTATIERGEPVVAARVSPKGLTGLAALVPAGRRAVAVPTDPRTPPLERGQTVDLWAAEVGASSGLTADTIPGGSGPRDARRVASAGTVVDADDRHVTIAIVSSDVPAVTGALIDGTVVITLAGG
jgi:hypothetical protein